MKISKENFIIKPEWKFFYDGFKTEIKIIPNKVAYLKMIGVANEQSVKYMMQIYDQIFEDGYFQNNYLFRITDYSELLESDISLRKMYTTSLNKIHLKHKKTIKTAFVINPSLFFRTTIKLAKIIYRDKIEFVKSTEEALNKINKIEKSKQVLDTNLKEIETTKKELNDLVEYTKQIAKNQEIKQIKLNKNSSLFEIYNALKISIVDKNLFIREQNFISQKLKYELEIEQAITQLTKKTISLEIKDLENIVNEYLQIIKKLSSAFSISFAFKQKLKKTKHFSINSKKTEIRNTTFQTITSYITNNKNSIFLKMTDIQYIKNLPKNIKSYFNEQNTDNAILFFHQSLETSFLLILHFLSNKFLFKTKISSMITSLFLSLTSFITRLENEETLKQITFLFETAFNSSTSIATIIAKKDFSVVNMNNSAKRMLELKENQKIKSLKFIFEELNELTPLNVEMEIKTLKQNTVLTTLTVSKLNDSEFIIMLQDISEIKINMLLAEQKMQELKNFNKLMKGREKRVEELKKELEELKQIKRKNL